MSEFSLVCIEGEAIKHKNKEDEIREQRQDGLSQRGQRYLLPSSLCCYFTVPSNLLDCQFNEVDDIIVGNKMGVVSQQIVLGSGRHF
jgi:hypothetical protein